MKLIRVALDHKSTNCSLMPHGAKGDSCFSTYFPALKNRLDDIDPMIDTFDSGGCKFKSDGSVVITIIENKMRSFSIGKWIKALWKTNPWYWIQSFTFWNILPKYVVIGDDNDYDIIALKIEDGTFVRQIYLCQELGVMADLRRGPFHYDYDSAYTTAKYKLSLVYEGKKDGNTVVKTQNHKTCWILFVMLDMDTLECKSYNIGNQGIDKAKILATFNNGKLAAVLLDGDLYFFNLTLSDPKEVFESRSKTHTNAKNFEEICDGFCITEYPDSFRAEEEYMTLKSETLSKPLQTWLDLLKRGKIGGLPD